jgi:GDPmannose 4,6-dehydratase
MKKALICGVSGQDGAYLAELLLKQGYTVCGTSRDAQISPFQNLVHLGIKDQVKLESMSLTDFRSVLQVLTKIQPDEVYNLAAIRFLGATIKLYNAGSSECFGDTGNVAAAAENTPFRPRSPYAVAKAAAFWEVANYREAYGLFACSGILFNHESPLRPERFVTQKIIATACRIAQGSKEKLYLGNMSIQRDWGWAQEYVEAMYLMLQQSQPDDYVIATGESTSLEDFVAAAFVSVNLDWHDHVVVDSSLFRPTDLSMGRGNPTKAKQQLGWEARYKMQDVVKMMVDARSEL